MGIADYHTVAQFDYPRGILLGKLGIMRDHNDQSLAGYLLHKIHDLHACRGIECSCRFIRKQYLRIVHESAGYRDALALSARKLVRTLVELITQSDFFQSFRRSAPAFGFADACNRKRKLDVAEYRLVRNQVVTLKHKPYAVIAVYVPVAVGK